MNTFIELTRYKETNKHITINTNNIVSLECFYFKGTQITLTDGRVILVKELYNDLLPLL